MFRSSFRDPYRDALRNRLSPENGQTGMTWQPQLPGAMFTHPINQEPTPPNTSGYRSNTPSTPGHFQVPDDSPPVTTPTTPGHFSRPDDAPPAANIPSPQPVGNTPTGVSPYGQPLTGAVPQDQWNQLLASNQQVAAQIQDIFMRKYGMIPGGQATLVSLVNKVVNEGYPMEAIQQLIDSGYNQDDIFRQAADAVQLEFGPQESAIQRAIAEILRQSDRDMSLARNTGDWAQHLMGQIYDQGQAQYETIRENIGQGFEGTQNAISSGHNLSLDALRNFMDAGNAQITAGAELAGSQDALGTVFGDIEQQVMPGVTQMARNMGTDLGLNANIAATENARAGGLAGALVMQGQNAQGGAVSQMLAAIGDILNQRTGAINEQHGLLSDIGANRGAAMRNAVDELRMREQELERQAELDALNERVAEANIAATEAGIEQGDRSLDLQERQQIHDQAMDIRRFGLDSQQASAAIALIQAQIRSAGVSDQVAMAEIQQILANVGLTEAEQQRVMADIGLIGAQTGNVNAETAALNDPNHPSHQSGSGSGDEGPDPTGSPIQAAHQYLADYDVPIQNLNAANQVINQAHGIISQIGAGPQPSGGNPGVIPLGGNNLEQIKAGLHPNLHAAVDMAAAGASFVDVARAIMPHFVNTQGSLLSPQHVGVLLDILLGNT